MIRYVTLTCCSLLLLGGLLTLNSCLNPCRKVECQNGGTCDEGICVCPEGYEGTTCETVARDKFLGTFTMAENCVSGSSDYTITIRAGSSLNEVTISNLYSQGEEINAQVVGPDLIFTDQSLDIATISGSASVSNGIVTFFYSVSIGSNADSCSGTAQPM